VNILPFLSLVLITLVFGACSKKETTAVPPNPENAKIIQEGDAALAAKDFQKVGEILTVMQSVASQNGDSELRTAYSSLKQKLRDVAEKDPKAMEAYRAESRSLQGR
jgi:hypothetical protein